MFVKILLGIACLSVSSLILVKTVKAIRNIWNADENKPARKHNKND